MRCSYSYVVHCEYVSVSPMHVYFVCRFFFFNATPTTEIYTYGHTPSLLDALPIEIRLSRASTVDSTFGNMPRPMAKKTKPKISSSQKIWDEEVAASWDICGMKPVRQWSAGRHQPPDAIFNLLTLPQATKIRIIETTNANRPRSSAAAKPMNRRPCCPSAAAGLGSALSRKEPKTLPTPSAAMTPPNPAGPPPNTSARKPAAE